MGTSAAERKVRYRLRHETPYYAKHCLKVVNERGELVPFVYRKAQLKLDRALEAQRAAGRPMRAIVLKSRKVGISTSVQAKIFHSATMVPNDRALIVAQDTDTAGELFDISDTFYSHLPADAALKPGLVSRRASPGGMKQLIFGEPSRLRRAQGELGLNSSIKIDTAKEVQAGRGKTIRRLHATEVAFWEEQVGRGTGAGAKKAVSLLNAVPDAPDTLIVLESTANGHNFFKARWDRAERGDGAYVAVFIGWTEDENCTRHFTDDDERARFVESIGTGDWGDDERHLIERFGCTHEQLHWRRTTIVDKCDSDLSTFRQEYPSTPLEAFIGSGKHVFSIKLIERAEDDAKQCDPPVVLVGDDPAPGDGLLIAKAFRQRILIAGTQEVPTGALWLPGGIDQARSGKALWRVWEHPRAATVERDDMGREVEVPAEPHVIFVDVAAGEEQTSSGESDYSAIQVINHMTGMQVAQWSSRCDRDEVALEALLAGLYFNDALIAVEITGGYGLTVVETLWKRLGYKKLYRRRPQGRTRDKQQTLLGWDTTRGTKPAMEDTFAELLREGSHGIRSLALIQELKTYVHHDNGRHGADQEAFDDLLMSYMGAQRVRQLVPVRVTRPKTRHWHNSMMRVPGRF